MNSRNISQALESNRKGYPMQRAMFLEFLDDRTTHYLDRQYMLGPNLLVAPVFVPEGEESEYYLPAGTWTSFFHPERTIIGPRWVKEVVPIDEIPVWVRPGSVLCLGPAGTGRPDYEYAKEIEIQVYELTEGQSIEVELPTGKGKEIAGVVKAERKQGELLVSVVSGTVALSGVTYFAGSQTKRTAANGEKQVSLAV
jgi:alpha-glucosidase (family GH31 glycosyl hydrolase)